MTNRITKGRGWMIMIGGYYFSYFKYLRFKVPCIFEKYDLSLEKRNDRPKVIWSRAFWIFRNILKYFETFHHLVLTIMKKTAAMPHQLYFVTLVLCIYVNQPPWSLGLGTDRIHCLDITTFYHTKYSGYCFIYVTVFSRTE